MRVLLDTHAQLWWFTDDARLSARARAIIADTANEILVSAASAWEVSTNHRLGKLDGALEVVARFAELVKADGFASLPLFQHHGLRAGAYVTPHRDPFDRMLAAQAEIEGVPQLTLDPAFSGFPVQTLW